MTLLATIRDAAFSRVSGVAWPWKLVRKSGFPTLQTTSVPQLGIFIVGETYNPDGDANVGPPRYIVDGVLGFSIVDTASKPEVLEGQVDVLVDKVLNTLLSDHTFLDLRDANEQPIIDSIAPIRRTYNYPQQGDAYYIECRLQMTIRYFCFFEPVAPNALLKIDVTTEITDPITGTTHPAVLEIDLDQ